MTNTRAARPEVRAYAATLVNEHEEYGKALRDLAQFKQVVLPSGMTPASKQQLDRLARVQGDAFDTAFIREARLTSSRFSQKSVSVRDTLDMERTNSI